MKTIQNIRRSNLLTLIYDHQGQNNLAEAIGKLPTQISHMTNKTRKGDYVRNVGHKMARHIEKIKMVHYRL